jgi:uncharacterized protein (DUF924 family)
MDHFPEGLDTQLKLSWGWAAEPKSSVALVALSDQDLHNMFRSSLDTFITDTKACETAAKDITQDFGK